MRITFILPTVSLTGGNKVVAIYAQKLMQNGHIVKLVSPPPRPMALRAKLRSWLVGRGWPPDVKSLQSPLDDADLDHTVLDRWRPVRDRDVPDADVIIATWWETAEWVNALGPEKGAKVYFIQGHEVFPYLPTERSKATYHLPFHKIVVSRWLEKIMTLDYGDPNVDLVPNSVDHGQFFAPIRGKGHTPTVGFLYSSSAPKGLDVLLDALTIVRRRWPDLTFVAFGSQLPIASLPLPERTKYHHRPPQDKIRDIYAACDVWVTASTSEGFNLPAMEAMACRTPVVSSRVGWPEEAVKTGWNGVLVDVDDVSGLAEGIEWVLSQTDEAWRTLSANAFATVAESSWEASALLFEEALIRAQARASRGEILGGRAGRCAGRG
ncbi:glycosyltransferase family 4 protein [Bradyrhizobium sp. CB3481]|uniref:glycosyltransferase family 4 protein n=1 Tax=Bradyrhizobium sp. CB3481 TaxID=3039158 RepID=UPI0024B17010|nr:glycosyltransferase family 4 protein [Bradyrhizobium sp. CB3481]WFU18787.1 glycosyltransferase family 4 protein [Bradyrhizobium sp. CB3481]